MKRFLCVVLLFMMIVPSALALDFEGYNNVAKNFGASALDPANAKDSGTFKSYIQDDCTLAFEETNGELSTIIIQGKGDSFVAYCCATFFLLDPSGDTKTNLGEFLAAYLLAHTTTDEYTYGQTTNGIVFFIQLEKNGFSFMVMK